MAQENIKINKRLYSRSDVSDNIDLSFSELLNVDNRSNDVKIKAFFDLTSKEQEKENTKSKKRDGITF